MCRGLGVAASTAVMHLDAAVKLVNMDGGINAVWQTSGTNPVWQTSPRKARMVGWRVLPAVSYPIYLLIPEGPS